MREFLTFVLMDGALLFGLFYLVTFLIALTQQDSRVQELTARLRGVGLVRGSLYATLAGAVTPFCSCSTIPVVSGMFRARIRFGTSMTFLMASPLVSESVVIVMLTFFGVWSTATFVAMAMVLPVLAGIAFDYLGLERFLRQATEADIPGQVTHDGGKAVIPWRARVRFANLLARAELRAVFGYILVGLVVGGAIYGFIPDSWITSLTEWVSPVMLVPLMAILGAPLYFNMAAAIPVAFALTEKHLPLGPIVAFLVAGAGLSTPEVVLLSKLFRPPLLAAYVAAMLVIATAMGYVFLFIA